MEFMRAVFAGIIMTELWSYMEESNMRTFTMTTFDREDINKVTARPGIGDSIFLVVERNTGEDNHYVSETRYRLSPKQAKELYKSLKKHMYK